MPSSFFLQNSLKWNDSVPLSAQKSKSITIISILSIVYRNSPLFRSTFCGMLKSVPGRLRTKAVAKHVSKLDDGSYYAQSQQQICTHSIWITLSSQPNCSFLLLLALLNAMVFWYNRTIVRTQQPSKKSRMITRRSAERRVWIARYYIVIATPILLRSSVSRIRS